MKICEKEKIFSVYCVGNDSYYKSSRTNKKSFETNSKFLFFKIAKESTSNSSKMIDESLSNKQKNGKDLITEVFEQDCCDFQLFIDDKEIEGKSKHICHKVGKKLFICLFDKFLYCYNMTPTEIVDLLKKLETIGIKPFGIKIEAEYDGREGLYNQIKDEIVKPLINVIKDFGIKFISIGTGSNNLFDFLIQNFNNNDVTIIDVSNKKTNNPEIEVIIPEVSFN